MIWTLEDHPLIESEVSFLSFYCENFEEKYEFSNPPVSTSFHTPIPEDAVIEDMKRFDYDTSLGFMVEVFFPKRKQLNKLALKGKRFSHLRTVVTNKATPLLMRNEDEEE